MPRELSVLAWQAVREGKHWGWGLLGCMVLVTYGFVPCAQPISLFGRIYAGKVCSHPYLGRRRTDPHLAG